MGLTGVLIRTAAAPALRRAAPVYVGIAIVAAVIFGPTGMHPRDITLAAARSPGFAVVLWAIWLLAAAPAVQAVIHTRALEYLRWLPVRRGLIWVVLAGMSLLFQLPWALLWWSGSGAVDALAHAVTAAALLATVFVNTRNYSELMLRIGVVVGVLAAAITPLSEPGTAVLGCAILAMAVPLAWARAPERTTGHSVGMLSSHPAVALAQCYVVGLLRTRAGGFTRGIIICCLGAGLMVLMGRANKLVPAEIAVYSAIIVTVTLGLAAGGLATPMAETERALRWLLDSTGTPREVRVLGRSVAAVGLGSVLGAVHGVLVSWGLGLGATASARVLGGAIAIAVGMALIARRGACWAERDDGIDGSRVVTVMVGATVVTLVGIGLFDDLAAVALLALAVAVSWAGHDSAR